MSYALLPFALYLLIYFNLTKSLCFLLTKTRAFVGLKPYRRFFCTTNKALFLRNTMYFLIFFIFILLLKFIAYELLFINSGAQTSFGGISCLLSDVTSNLVISVSRHNEWLLFWWSKVGDWVSQRHSFLIPAYKDLGLSKCGLFLTYFEPFLNWNTSLGNLMDGFKTASEYCFEIYLVTVYNSIFLWHSCSLIYCTNLLVVDQLSRVVSYLILYTSTITLLTNWTGYKGVFFSLIVGSFGPVIGFIVSSVGFMYLNEICTLKSQTFKECFRQPCGFYNQMRYHKHYKQYCRAWIF